MPSLNRALNRPTLDEDGNTVFKFNISSLDRSMGFCLTPLPPHGTVFGCRSMQLVRLPTFDAAHAECERLEAEERATAAAAAAAGVKGGGQGKERAAGELEGDGSGSDNEDEGDENDGSDGSDAEEEEEEADDDRKHEGGDDDEDEEEEEEEEEEEDVAVVRSREAEVDAEEEAAFDKEFAAMMSVRRQWLLSPSFSVSHSPLPRMLNACGGGTLASRWLPRVSVATDRVVDAGAGGGGDAGVGASGGAAAGASFVHLASCNGCLPPRASLVWILTMRACGAQESLGYAKLAVKPSTLNIPPPSLNAMSLGLGSAPAAAPPPPSASSGAASGFPGGGITFKLLTKKAGGKQTVKELQVPEDSTFALSTRRKEEQYQEERSELKRLVLVRCPLSPLACCVVSVPCPAPSRGSTGLAGVSTRPAGLPHQWGATSCTRKAAPLTYCVGTAISDMRTSASCAACDVLLTAEPPNLSSHLSSNCVPPSNNNPSFGLTLWPGLVDGAGYAGLSRLASGRGARRYAHNVAEHPPAHLPGDAAQRPGRLRRWGGRTGRGGSTRTPTRASASASAATASAATASHGRSRRRTAAGGERVRAAAARTQRLAGSRGWQPASPLECCWWWILRDDV